MSQQSILAVVLAATLSAVAQNHELGQDSSVKRNKATVFKVGEDITAPRPLYQPDPEYSEQARRAKLQGKCLLWLIVGTDGRPHNIKVARSLGMGLDETAIAAVRRWRFEPAQKSGHPVAIQINVEITYRLGSRSAEQIQALWEKMRLTPSPDLAVSKIIEPCPPETQNLMSPQLKTTVAEVTFEGDLKLEISERELIAASIKNGQWRGGIDEITAQILEFAKAAWQDRGYLKATVTGDSRLTTGGPAVQTIAVTAHIDEGERYRLGHIEFQNNKAITNTSALRELFLIRDGDLFKRDVIAKGIQNLRRAYGELGYVNFTSVPETQIDEENRRIDLYIDVDEGKKFFISDISIVAEDESGLQTGMGALPLEPGQVYNERLANLFLHRLKSVPSRTLDIRMNEEAGVVSLTFDLRHCAESIKERELASSQ